MFQEEMTPLNTSTISEVLFFINLAAIITIYPYFLENFAINSFFISGTTF